MSTPISRPRLRAALLASALAALAGCVGGAGGSPGLGLGGLLGGAGTASGGGQAEAPRAVAVTADLVAITGPRGFCIDPTATRTEDDAGFVLLGNCAAISGNPRAPQPRTAALLTAAVSGRTEEGAAPDGGIATLAGLFATEAGRGLLSRSGDPGDVVILETRSGDDMVAVHARDTSPGALAGVAQEYWRAYLDLGPRIATLSVLGLADDAIEDARAWQLLDRFASAVRAANGLAGE